MTCYNGAAQCATRPAHLSLQGRLRPPDTRHTGLHSPASVAPAVSAYSHLQTWALGGPSPPGPPLPRAGQVVSQMMRRAHSPTAIIAHASLRFEVIYEARVSLASCLSYAGLAGECSAWQTRRLDPLQRSSGMRKIEPWPWQRQVPWRNNYCGIGL